MAPVGSASASYAFLVLVGRRYQRIGIRVNRRRSRTCHLGNDATRFRGSRLCWVSHLAQELLLDFLTALSTEHPAIRTTAALHGPGESGTAADNRLFVEAVLFRFRAGVPWRDLPERFGDWKIVYQRFNRWAKSGVFERVFRLLASDHDNEYMMIDATIVHAHQHSAGAQKSSDEHSVDLDSATQLATEEPRLLRVALSLKTTGFSSEREALVSVADGALSARDPTAPIGIARFGAHPGEGPGLPGPQA